MNAHHRRAGTLIERTDTPAGIEIREVIPGCPDAWEPITTGAWTIRQPAPPAPATTEPEQLS